MSETFKRQIRVYPMPKYELLIKAYMAETGLSQSKAIGVMIKQFFDLHDPVKLDRIVSNYRFIQSNQ